MLAYVLGHRPDEFGLFFDEQGFVAIKELLIALREEGWSFVRESHLKELIREPEDTGFETSGKMIRVIPANTHLELGPFPETIPPALLYHAARRKSYPTILKYGLKPTQWPWVRLYPTPEMALRVGSRRDKQPILLTIQAAKAGRQGTTFYRPLEFIYLTKAIDPKYFYAPPMPKEKITTEKKKTPPVPAPQTPGSFTLVPERDPDIGRRNQFDKKRKKRKEKDKDWKRASRKIRRDKYR